MRSPQASLKETIAGVKKKIGMICTIGEPVEHLPAIRLKRTDTTLDLSRSGKGSWREERKKGFGWWAEGGFYIRVWRNEISGVKAGVV